MLCGYLRGVLLRDAGLHKGAPARPASRVPTKMNTAPPVITEAALQNPGGRFLYMPPVARERDPTGGIGGPRGSTCACCYLRKKTLASCCSGGHGAFSGTSVGEASACAR